MSISRVTEMLGRAWRTAEPAIKRLQTETVKQYDTIMAKNVEYVVKDKDQADKLLRQWFFTQLSRIPAASAQAAEEGRYLQKRLGSFRELPVPELTTYLGFAAELYAWFVVGEIVGRGGTLTSYEI